MEREIRITVKATTGNAKAIESAVVNALLTATETITSVIDIQVSECVVRQP